MAEIDVNYIEEVQIGEGEVFPCYDPEAVHNAQFLGKLTESDSVDAINDIVFDEHNTLFATRLDKTDCAAIINDICFDDNNNRFPTRLGKSDCGTVINNIVFDNNNSRFPTRLNRSDCLAVIRDFIYPVGSYFETSDSSFNPNSAWGGTWVEVDGTFVNGVDVAVNITSYTSPNSPYVFPSNGVIKVACGYEAGNSMMAQVLDADDISNVALCQSSTYSYSMKSSQHVQAVVYKGQRCYCTKQGSSNNSAVHFFPYTYSTKRWHRIA